MSQPDEDALKDLGLRRLGGDPTVPVFISKPAPAAAPPPDETPQGMKGSDVLSGYDFNDYRRDANAHAHADPGATLVPEPVAKAPEPFVAEPIFIEPKLKPKPRPAPTLPSGPPPSLYSVYGDDVDEKPPAGPSIFERVRRFVLQYPAVIATVLAVIVISYFVVQRLTVDRDLTPLSKLKKQATRMDGQTVKVAGRVGDVFQMGSSYAYYLLQGRDTIVVFTRTRTPVPRQRVKISGSVSTGYLEGRPRVALFETP